MGSAFAPWWRRALYRVPFLFVGCPGGNFHWRWRRACICASGDNGRWSFVRVADRWFELREPTYWTEAPSWYAARRQAKIRALLAQLPRPPSAVERGKNP